LRWRWRLARLFAADLSLPVKPMSAPPPPPVANWTGCYVNGGGGYGMWNQDSYFETFPAPFVPLAANGTNGGRGWFGVVGGGCDYQLNVFGAGLVIGGFGDFDFMHLHGDFSPSSSTVVGDENERSAWAAGGRIGYLVTPDLLTYFDGGYTQTHFDGVNLTTVAGATPLTLGSHTYSGYFLGGGLEYALNFTWLPVHGLFWRNEYRVANYSSTDLPMPGVPPGLGLHITPYTQTVVSSLVWRFP
jgi:outer membrane immunogenic protein